MTIAFSAYSVTVTPINGDKISVEADVSDFDDEDTVLDIIGEAACKRKFGLYDRVEAEDEFGGKEE